MQNLQEAQPIRVEFSPSDDLLRAFMELPEDYKQLFLNELKKRRNNMAFISCNLVNDKGCAWAQGRVQELGDMVDKFEHAFDILQKRKESQNVARNAARAM